MSNIVIIDNYDSFTYNLSHMVKELGARVTVIRNDQFTLNQLKPFDKIILSPGPGIPSEAGLLTDVIKAYSGHKPILGVCLGHQAIGEVFGGRLENLPDVYHGVATECTQYGNDYIFNGMPKRITIGRYHSWVVSKTSFPECLDITAVSDDGNIMALRHKHHSTQQSRHHTKCPYIVNIIVYPFRYGSEETGFVYHSHGKHNAHNEKNHLQTAILQRPWETSLYHLFSIHKFAVENFVHHPQHRQHT